MIEVENPPALPDAPPITPAEAAALIDDALAGRGLVPADAVPELAAQIRAQVDAAPALLQEAWAPIVDVLPGG